MDVVEENGRIILTDGVAEFRYKIKEPQSEETIIVDCKIQTPVNQNQKTTINPGDTNRAERFTLNATRSGNNVAYTVRSNISGSTTVVSLTVVEYRPGNSKPIGSVVSDVILTNGVGTYIYSIVETRPSTLQKVKSQLTEFPEINTETIIQ